MHYKSLKLIIKTEARSNKWASDYLRIIDILADEILGCTMYTHIIMAMKNIHSRPNIKVFIYP